MYQGSRGTNPKGPGGGKEGAGYTEPQEGKMAGQPRPITVSTKQERIAMLARQMPEAALTSLSHHIDIEWMKEALLRTRADGATGVDGVTCEEYVRNLEVNLQALLDRAASPFGKTSCDSQSRTRTIRSGRRGRRFIAPPPGGTQMRSQAAKP